MRAAVERIRVNWPKRVAATVVVVVFIASAGVLHAQGIGSLSQLLGGFQHSRGSSQSGSAVAVQRNAAPYMGEFTGR